MNLSGANAGEDAGLSALLLAYPDLEYDAASGAVFVPGSGPIDVGEVRGNISPLARLAAPTLAEQFYQAYPLNFDLTSRAEPFFDPGRYRNAAFFEALYFASAAEARKTLRVVRFDGLSGAGVSVTTHRGVACQLEAVIAELAGQGPELGPFFETPGGGFNWRTISGTNRLSAHSFGIAVDINASLGGYWKWAGAPEGNVGAFETTVPEELVAAFERYGFIWGGKWHHYDGMHFEYRPELILYSRLLSGTSF